MAAPHAETPTAKGYRLTIVADSREAGGAEVFLGYLCGALPERAGVTVVCSAPVADLIRRARPSASALDYGDGLRRAIAALRESAPDLVHVNATHPRSCRFFVHACRLLGIPFIVVDHSVYGRLTRSGVVAQRTISRWAAARVAVGRRSAELMDARCHLAAGTFRAIQNGVPPLQAVPPQPRDGRLVLGFLGRLEHEKGLDLLLRAVADVGPDVDLLVAGSGSQADALSAQVRDLDLSGRVMFLGRQVPQTFLAGVDVLVLPSRSESLPLSIVEAMFVGRPALATDVGSVRELIQDGITGWMVPPADPGALADALRNLQQHPETILAAGQAARAAAGASLTDTAMAAAYDRLYLSIIRPGTTDDPP